MLARHPARARAAPLLESQRGGRRTIAAAESYGQADRVLETLAERGFPVERLAIVAPDMRYLQNQPRPLQAFVRGLVSASWAAVVGALAGLLLGLFDVVDPLVPGLALTLWGAAIGAALGAIGVLVLLLVNASAPDAAAGRIVASRFEVVGDQLIAERAGRVLDASPGP
jgi:hypothetical protein